jgi:hypothetical protein
MMIRLWVRAERAAFVGPVQEDTKGIANIKKEPHQKNSAVDQKLGQKIKVEEKSAGPRAPSLSSPAASSSSIPVQLQKTLAIDSLKREEQKAVRLALISAIKNTPPVKLSILPLHEDAPRLINYLWFAPRLPFREACDALGRCMYPFPALLACASS